MNSILKGFMALGCYEVVISSDFLTPDDNVLFVDEFLAYGNAALGTVSSTHLGMYNRQHIAFAGRTIHKHSLQSILYQHLSICFNWF